MAIYQCDLCGYRMDEADKEILFENLPDDWVCPICGVGKYEFVPEEE